MGGTVGFGCGSCDAEVLVGQTFCTNCGERVEWEKLRLQEGSIAPGLFCENCRVAMVETARFCGHCGSARGVPRKGRR